MQTLFEIEISMDSGGTLMAKTASRNLTTGSPTRLVIGFLLPLLGGLLFQQLYNMVDTLVVGRFLGMDALAGVGSTSSVNFLVLGFCIGICNGFVIPVAQKFGERDYPGLKRFVVNAILLAVTFYGEKPGADKMVTFAFIWVALAIFVMDAIYTQRRKS